MGKYSKHSQSGNVFFIILIAIALFGALSFAVTSTSRVGGSDISKEKAHLYAGEILQLGKTVKFAVKRVMTVNNCSETDISFENAAVSGYEHASPARDECKIFHPSGGGLSYREADSKWLDGSKSADSYFGEVAFANIRVGWSATNEPGTTEQDIVMFVPYLSSVVCDEIKAKLDTPRVGTEGGPHVRVLFDGDFTSSYQSFDNAFDAHYHGNTGSVPFASCVKLANDGVYGQNTYMFYQVLVPR